MKIRLKLKYRDEGRLNANMAHQNKKTIMVSKYIVCSKKKKILKTTSEQNLIKIYSNKRKFITIPSLQI